MGYTIEQIQQLLNAQFVLREGDANWIEHLLIDSRKVVYPETSLFFAISTQRNDGHYYLQDVYDAGVRNFVIERKAQLTLQQLSALKGSNIVLVDHSISALQKLASTHRKQFTIPVVGITGSNGKTIVKEWLYQLLKDDVQVARNPKSYNSQVGVPLSVWQLNDQHALGIFEAGISQPGEMAHLERIIQPNIGIFTMLGHAHDEGFANREAKITEKFKLFEQVDMLIASDEQVEVRAALQTFANKHPHVKICTWSRTNSNAVLYFTTQQQEHCTVIQSRSGARILSVRIPFTDEASIENACTCFAFILCLQRASTDVLSRFEELQAVEMRMQLKEAINNCMVINDSYSADIDSLRIALDFVEQQSAGLKRTLILSDILQTGQPTTALYTEIAKLIRQKGIQRFIGIGKELQSHSMLFDGSAEFYESTAAFVKQFSATHFQNELILLKGARLFAFEKINTLLEKRVHETVMEINLNALVHNLNIYRSKLKPGVKVMAMVKAFSYGAGSYEIAKVLAFNRVDYLTVAYADEGVVLRKAGIKLPIMVMNPEPSSFNQIVQYNLEPELYNMYSLHQLITAIDGEEIGVHIELDCGMKRLGFNEPDLELLLQTLYKHPHIRIKSVFAHLAASEDKKHDAFTHEQIAAYERMANQVTAAFDYPILKHVLNSSGIVRFSESQLDMVRLGIGLYGIDPSGILQKQLQPIGTLKTVISQIRHVKAHETIGYSRRGVVTKDSLIATVAIGYADGYNRKLGNGKGSMLIKGHKVATIGSICMDMTMLDVTGLNVKEGDEVIVYGEELNLEDVSAKVGTIPYEVLTSISQRVKRVYYFE
ncbi:MAG: bifunctional UDP-N-acetylmuramoyl-tripeptide:D-alanyl-D-alanine ligase/alanine racemase [Bacteroidia bacterium]|jgi:alanine racemase|nr:bifunctional UDP-N-acetylmuramoyl-tripeptide:D-alanyl-D-alanine ligase/alanine racemase [Bacteroidia bacterium]